jgi:hypothetical protein
MVAETQITDDEREMHLKQIDDNIEECVLNLGIDEKNVLKLASIEKVLYNALKELKDYMEKYGDKDGKADKIFAKAVQDHKSVCSDIIKAWHSTDDSRDSDLANYIIKLSDYFYEPDKPYTLTKTLYEGLCKLKNPEQKDIVLKILQEKVDLVIFIAAIFNIQKGPNFEDLLVAEKLFYPLIPTSDKEDTSGRNLSDISHAHYRACQFIIQDWDDKTSVAESDFTNYIVKLLSYLPYIENPKELAKLIQLGMNKLKDPNEKKWVEDEILSKPELIYHMTLAFEGLKNLSTKNFIAIEVSLNRSIDGLNYHLNKEECTEKDKVRSYIEKVKSLHINALFNICDKYTKNGKITEELAVLYMIKLLQYFYDIKLIELAGDYRGIAGTICEKYKLLDDPSNREGIEHLIIEIEKHNNLSFTLKGLEFAADLALKNGDLKKLHQLIEIIETQGEAEQQKDPNDPYVKLYEAMSDFYNGKLAFHEKRIGEAQKHYRKARDISFKIDDSNPLQSSFNYIYIKSIAEIHNIFASIALKAVDDLPKSKVNLNKDTPEGKILLDKLKIVNDISELFKNELFERKIAQYDQNHLIEAQTTFIRSLQDIGVKFYLKGIQDSLKRKDRKLCLEHALSIFKVLNGILDLYRVTKISEIENWRKIDGKTSKMMEKLTLEEVIINNNKETNLIFTSIENINSAIKLEKEQEAKAEQIAQALKDEPKKTSSKSNNKSKSNPLKQYNAALSEINGKLNKVKKALTASELPEAAKIFKNLASKIHEAKAIQPLPENIEPDFVKALEATITAIKGNRNLKNRNNILGDLEELLENYKPKKNAGEQEEKPNFPVSQVQQTMDKKEFIATKAVKQNGFVEVGPSKKTHNKPKAQLTQQKKPTPVAESKVVTQTAVKPTPKATDVDLSKYNWAKPKANNEKASEVAKPSVNPVAEAKKDIVKEVPIKTPTILTVTELEKKWVKRVEPDLDKMSEDLKAQLRIKEDPIKKVKAKKEAELAYLEAEKMLKSYEHPNGDRPSLKSIKSDLIKVIDICSEKQLFSTIIKANIDLLRIHALEAEESSKKGDYRDATICLKRGIPNAVTAIGLYLDHYTGFIKIILTPSKQSNLESLAKLIESSIENYKKDITRLVPKDKAQEDQENIIKKINKLLNKYEEDKKEIKLYKGYKSFYEAMNKDNDSSKGMSV